jgi:hypothetical protein
VNYHKMYRGTPPDNDKPTGRPPGSGPEFKWSKNLRTLIFWAVIFMAGLLFYQILVGGDREIVDISYTELLDQIKQGNIAKAVFIEKEVKGDFVNTF